MKSFIHEIQQQPAALRTTFQFYSTDKGKCLFQQILKIVNSTKCSQVLFTGMGSSWFLSQYAVTLLSKWTVPVLACEASELLHENAGLIHPGTLLFIISQSGESYEVTALLEQLEKSEDQLAGVVGITNNITSTLGTCSQFILPLLAGEEERTASKTFVSCALLLILFSDYVLGKVRKTAEIEELALQVEEMVTHPEKFIGLAGCLEKCSSVHCLGRGKFILSAQQIALMLMEVAKLPATAMSCGGFRHGPIEAVDDHFTAILCTHSCSSTYSKCISLASDIVRFGGKLILMTDRAAPIEDINLYEVRIPGKNLDFFELSAVVVMQLVVYNLALKKGLVPGSFIHGNKITDFE